MKRTLLALVLSVGTITTGHLVGQAIVNEAGAHSADLCEYEDSVQCVWDAKHMGNGYGRSFRVNRQGDIFYISHQKAHHLAFGHEARD